MKIILVTILIISALFAGCVSPENNAPVKKDVILDIDTSNIKVKNGELKQIKIRVNNSGNSSIMALVRFNINSSDRQYLNFTPSSYNAGILRPGEDSGRRNVDLKASLPAGNNITYLVRVETVDTNKDVVIDSKDMTITVERN